MNTLHANFNGGLMTPLMGGRFDTEKLRTGCKVLKNMIPSVYGGVFKRPGTQYLGQTKDNNKARLYGFKRSVDVNYMLEFTDERLRFWTSSITSASLVTISSADGWLTSTSYVVGDYVDNSGTIYICETAHTSGTFATDLAAGKWVAQTTLELVTPYAQADLFDLQFCQLNDVLFIAHPDYYPRRLTRNSATSWTLEVVPFEFAPVLDTNKTTVAVQLQYDEAAWVTSTAYSVGDRVLADDGQVYTCFNAHTSATADEPGKDPATANWATYWNLGSSSESVSAWANATSYTAGNKVKVDGVIYRCTANHTSTSPAYYGITRRLVGGNGPTNGQSWTSFWVIDGAATDLTDIGLKLTATDDLFASADVDTTWQINIGSGSRAVTADVTTSEQSSSIFVQGPFTVSTAWTTGNGLIGSVTLEESLDGVTWSSIRVWTSQASTGNISYEGTAPDVGAWYRLKTDVDTAASAGNAILEPVNSVLNIPVNITAYTSASEVSCGIVLRNNQMPPIDIVGVSTTDYQKAAFSSTQGFPRSVAFHDGRLWWAGTSEQGSRLWASKVDDFYTYLTGADDDSALDLSLAATQANQILWMASHNRALVVGTSSQEWTIDGGDAETVITPSNRRARMRTNHGSLGIPPNIIAESLLWVTRQGLQLREFTYQFQTDGFTAPDMTALIGRMHGGVVQTCCQASPEPLLWVCDGTNVYSFSYDREQQVTAWSKHTTGESASDAFESVASMYGAQTFYTEETWFSVKRTVNGGTVRYLERFNVAASSGFWSHRSASTARFMADCVMYQGSFGASPTMVDSGSDCVVTGFSHLAGRSVVAVDTSHQFGTGTLDASGNGTILGFNESGAAFGDGVGLAFEAELQAFPLDAVLQDGTGQGRNWRPARVDFLLHDSMGGTYGPTLDLATYAIEYPSTASFPFRGRTGDNHLLADWAATTELAIKHSDPTPFGVLGYILKSEVSGT